MKKICIVTFFIVIGVVSLSVAGNLNKTDCIYGSKIDQLISFYQARLYLKGSDYTILSNIGDEAERAIQYLQSKKEQLVMEMKQKKIGFESDIIKRFVVNKTRTSDMGLGYTQP